MQYLSLMLAWLVITTPVAPENGVTVSLDGRLLDAEGLAFCEGDEIYIPLGETAEALGAKLVWDENTETVTVIRDDIELTAHVGDRYIVANGRYLFVTDGVRLVSSQVMVTASALAKAFGLESVYFPSLRWLRLTTSGEAIESAESFYDEEDLYWLSHIIEAEAGVEIFDGKIAVGNVVLNRCAYYEFPDTIKEVIFDNRFGIQFSPAYSGGINKTPSKDSIIAAKLCLDGANTAGASLYFCANSHVPNSYAGRTRQVYAVIDSQTFFL